MENLILRLDEERFPKKYFISKVNGETSCRMPNTSLEESVNCSSSVMAKSTMMIIIVIMITMIMVMIVVHVVVVYVFLNIV